MIVCAALAPGRLQRALSWAPLRWLGKICYGLYLWHTFVGLTVAHVIDAAGLPWGPSLRVACWLGCTLAVATASWFLFEQPILGLKPAPTSANHTR